MTGILEPKGAAVLLGFNPLRRDWVYRLAPEAPLFRGIPTGPEAFLEPPGACGFRSWARIHLKKKTCATLVLLVGRMTKPSFKWSKIITACVEPTQNSMFKCLFFFKWRVFCIKNLELFLHMPLKLDENWSNYSIYKIISIFFLFLKHPCIFFLLFSSTILSVSSTWGCLSHEKCLEIAWLKVSLLSFNCGRPSILLYYFQNLIFYRWEILHSKEYCYRLTLKLTFKGC